MNEMLGELFDNFYHDNRMKDHGLSIWFNDYDIVFRCREILSSFIKGYDFEVINWFSDEYMIRINHVRWGLSGMHRPVDCYNLIHGYLLATYREVS